MSIQIEKKKHQWAAGGVSGYPLTHPIVGQTKFFNQFRQFIHLVDDESEKFAHVFAIIGQWGIGKSRLAYELTSQINDTSPGWYVRDASGHLTRAQLFHDDADREGYLGLYLRYSQVATESHNIDNWFGFGLYKALLPLTRDTFDTSIQGQIAKEAYDRLLVRGFDAARLAEVLEVSAHHGDEALYEDPTLVTRLCQAAYAYLREFGVTYVLIALDELETAAEAATYGLEGDEIKRLDGRAIKLIGKAIKEEDPRGKLPWLRYVALCSPAIGHELREVRSTARRFELTELAANSFADVSGFVTLLAEDQRLSETYPAGLVEAAYAMSGGNFGWFNVVMANIDGVLSGRRARGHTAAATIGGLMDEAVRVSSRIAEHVLDHQAIAELNLPREYLTAAKELLYGQLPLPIGRWSDDERRALLAATNEYGEPAAILYQRVDWSEHDLSAALRAAKFTRDQSEWRLGGVDEPLDLGQLLANVATYSIHETRGNVDPPGRRVLLVPLTGGDFAQLVSVLYPHPAAEDAARAIWRAMMGDDGADPTLATHMGPSIDMLARLDLRLRKQGTTSLILREPDQSAAHEQAIAACKGQPEKERARQILTGAMRALDENWDYEPVDAGLRGELVAITTSASRGAKGGLVTCDALRLHPESRLIMAWVRRLDELTELCDRVGQLFPTHGRIPVVAFTSSRALVDQFASDASPKLRDARESLMLYQLASREEFVLHSIGLAKRDCRGFQLQSQRFTSAFLGRLQGLLRPLRDAIHDWRRELDRRGRIAWPLRAGGIVKDDDRDQLFQAYRKLFIEPPAPRPLVQLDEASEIDAREVLETLERMRISPKAKAAGYLDSERCGLFTTLDDRAEPAFPGFLQRICDRLLNAREWSLDAAEQEWFWGYAWEGAKPAETFQQWMVLAHEIGFADVPAEGARRNDKRYRLVERAALGGAWTAARNWLANQYPEVVRKMQEVFGEGKVGEYFDPLGSSRPGTKTLEAKRRLDAAERALGELDIAEAGWNTAATADERRERFIACSRQRLEIGRDVEWVYQADGYRSLVRDDSLKMLNFDNDDVSLWKRIGQAKLFVEYVEDAKRRMGDAVDRLKEEMREATREMPGFPLAVCTRSLEKIANILAGSIAGGSREGDTRRFQDLTPGTLAQALRDLKVWQASEKLGQLAAEVGIQLDSEVELPLAEINGVIVRSFHELAKSYHQERTRLADLTQRLTSLESVLDGVPDDFSYPESLSPLAELTARPTLIESEMTESLSDDVDPLISEHAPSSRLGNFQPLMEATKGLLTGPKRGLGSLAGQVTTLENAVHDYRRRLLADDELRQVEQGYNALLQAQRKPRVKPLDMADLESAAGLRGAKALVERRCAAWPAEAETALDGSGVSFREWKAIVAALAEGRQPSVDAGQAEALVAKGFLERTYRLGGYNG
ncbi:MAG TPA: hypothetical protein VMV69_19260 [Pirellulales bacterium]|nr:hypothetical protein [Pirellulales bacterium]